MTRGKLTTEQIFGQKLTRQEVMQMIRETPGMYARYARLSPQLKKEFMDFCMGTCGLNLTYDPMFKEIFDPQRFPDRLEDFLSLCLGEEVEILSALPTESSRLTEEGSLLVMDLLVRLKSGSLLNVEIQRIGYMFPGQRCACYSSDLVMRQYSQVRSKCREENKPFSYQQICKVYTIVLFQHSPREFHQYPEEYLHYAKQQFNTGLKLDLVQEYLLIPLDIFLKKHQNIDKKLDAWLTLIASDEMERIREVIRAYPEFGEIYCQVFRFRYQMEELMNMFSDALKIMDANTTKYMVEQLTDENEQQRETIKKQGETIGQQGETIKKQGETIGQQGKAIKKKDEMIEQLTDENRQLQERVERLEAFVTSKFGPMDGEEV